MACLRLLSLNSSRRGRKIADHSTPGGQSRAIEATPCMTVHRRTWFDGSWHPLEGRPQRGELGLSTGSKGLKIPVSVVRFRPWAPIPRGLLIQQAQPV